MSLKSKFNVCVDFDGVLNDYCGYKGPEVLGNPLPGVEDFLKRLSHDYSVVILSTRKSERIIEWLKEHGLMQYVSKVTSDKVPAIAYIDDRGLKFDGDYGKTLEELENFKAHWE